MRVRNPEATCLRRAGHRTRGLERGGYQDPLQDEGGRGSSAACTGLAEDHRHRSSQHNLPPPQARQDHAMKRPPCKQFDVALVNSATSIVVKLSTVWSAIEKAPFHYKLV